MQWDRLRFNDEEFAQREADMKNLVSVEESECSIDMESGVGCRAGSSSFWMTWDGRMLPCGMMPGPETYPLQVGFDAAWQELRKQTQEIRTLFKCHTCKYKDVCGVCASVCVTETGEFHQVPEYMCERTKHMVRITEEMAEI